MKPARTEIMNMVHGIFRDPVRALLNLFALALLFFVAWRALGFVHGYDSAAFNLPYAARIAGLCGEDCLQLTPDLQTRFEHIPRLGHWLFAGAWMLTSSANAVGVVNFLSLMLVIVYLAWIFRIHWGLATIALIAVPFVRIEAVTASPNLLPAAFLVVGLFSVLDYILNPQGFTRSRAIFGLLMLAAASATKLQVYPVALLSVVYFATVVFWRHYQRKPNTLSFRPTARKRILALTLMIFAMAVTSAWQIRNAVIYKNPLYPVSVSVLGVELPGHFKGRVSLAEPHIDHHPLLRWAASVFEYRAYDHRHTPWTESQGHVQHDAWSFRIGGFNGVYVLLLMLFTSYLLRYRVAPEVRCKIAIFLAVFTLVFALLPASYYLRYNIWWILLLVGVTLIITADNFRVMRDRDTDALPLFRAVVIACCLASLLASGLRYLSPSNVSSARALAMSPTITRIVSDHNGAGSVLCVHQSRAFYYTHFFHEGAVHLTTQLHPRDYEFTDRALNDLYGCTYVVR